MCYRFSITSQGHSPVEGQALRMPGGQGVLTRVLEEEVRTPRGGRGKEVGEVAPTLGEGAGETRGMGEMVEKEEEEGVRRSQTWSPTSQRKPRRSRR